MERKRIIHIVALFLSFLFSGFCYAWPPAKNYELTKDGVIIYPDSNLSGHARAVRLQVISNKIIRITASATKTIPEVPSLITVYKDLKKNYAVTSSNGNVVVKTPDVTATIVSSTGAVSFTDKYGKPVLMERSYNGRSILPAIFDGEASYNLSQTFVTAPGEAYYGLGQHQSDQFNYKGQQVFLFQNNTEVAIPFLLSSKNYGILWDNYSITKVGDVRDFMPLSKLKLFSKDGDEGWLTASYNNDKSKPDEISFTKAESKIDYQYLGDSKKDLPENFNPQNGEITWEGSIESGFSGMHKFRIIYGGYMKIWIDGKLLADRWRQAWNPGSALLNLSLEKNKKYAIKIQWIPDGTESYLDVKWLQPIPTADVNAFTFTSEAGKQLDYYFVMGDNADDVISGYRTLTGKATIVPKWAMGFWQSRERYKTQDEVLNTVAEFRQRKIPLDNIVQDWSYWKVNDWGSQEFDASRFSNPDSMINILHDKYHVKFMISVWPKMYEGVQAYKDFDTQGWLYKRNIADSQRDWIGKGFISTFYDAFNPAARKGFWSLINKKLYSKGVDAWWMDASEPDILSNVSPAKRKEQMTPLALGVAAEYLNAYPLENAKGIYNGQRSVDPNKRVFLLTRSGFAGSQHYAASIWSGDIASRWEDMKSQISAGLNFSMSGTPFWTMDIGGFAVEHRYEKPNEQDLEEWRELQTRWYQFGAFVPLFRSHGQFPYREMFNVAPPDHPAYKSMLYYDKLRYRLMPYIYSLAAATYHHDYTIMRGLIMDFANDTTVKNIGDQYMFGPSLLINPVYNYKERNKSLYLPAGQGWYDFYSGKYMDGGRRITVDAPYERMPVFVKEGSIIPFGPELEYTSQKPADTLTLFVYTGRDGSFDLYEDDDTTYNYEKGAFSNINFTYNEANKKFTIGERKGSFNNMLTNRVFKIVWISKTEPKELQFENGQAQMIEYKGKEMSVFKK
ncbi:MAG: TIM-barrel domain-containing protein [Ginsengibacter sp.]